MKANKSYIDAYNPKGKNLDVCRRCGLCLQRCPVMKMDKRESCAEIARLQTGEGPLRILNDCTLCFNCNHYCPHGMNPFALIMERLADRVVRSGVGIPTYIQYLYAVQSESSVYTDIYQMLSGREKAVLDRWETPPPQSDEILFIGCIGRETPLKIANSKVLEHVPKYGPRKVCCGDLCFRYGDFDSFSKTVEYSFKLLERLNTKRLICYCGGCSHTFINIWKEYLGVTLPFEIVTIWEWLWKKVQNNSFHIKQKVNIRAALSDSCYCTGLGDTFMKSVRELHHASGMEIVELQNNRHDNLCCGATGMARNHKDLMAPQEIAERKIAQVRDTQVTDLACYCSGCYLMLADSCKDLGITPHYSLDYILWALGDEFSTETKDKLSIQRRLIVEKLLNSTS